MTEAAIGTRVDPLTRTRQFNLLPGQVYLAEECISVLVQLTSLSLIAGQISVTDIRRFVVSSFFISILPSVLPSRS